MVEAVEDVDAAGQGEGDPEEAVAQQLAQLSRDHHRDLDDGEAEFLALGPLSAEDDVDAGEDPDESHEKDEPEREGDDPRFENGEPVQGPVADGEMMEGVGVGFGMGDDGPVRHVGGEEEFLPPVLGVGEVIGESQHGDHDLQEIMTAEGARDGKHDVDDHEFRGRQGGARPAGFHPEVCQCEKEDDEGDVEEEGDGRGMARVPDQLRLNDPEGEDRHQRAGDRDRPYRGDAWDGRGGIRGPPRFRRCGALGILEFIQPSVPGPSRGCLLGHAVPAGPGQRAAIITAGAVRVKERVGGRVWCVGRRSPAHPGLRPAPRHGRARGVLHGEGGRGCVGRPSRPHPGSTPGTPPRAGSGRPARSRRVPGLRFVGFDAEPAVDGGGFARERGAGVSRGEERPWIARLIASP